MEYKNEWERYDFRGVIGNALRSAVYVISDIELKWAVEQYNLLLDALDGKITLPPEHLEMLKAARRAQLFSCIESKIPYPAHFDNACMRSGLRSRAIEMHKPENVTLATGVYNVNNSDLTAGPTSVVGAKYVLDGNRTPLVALSSKDVSLYQTNGAEFADVSICTIVIIFLVLICIILGGSIASYQPNESTFSTRDFAAEGNSGGIF